MTEVEKELGKKGKKVVLGPMQQAPQLPTKTRTLRRNVDRDGDSPGETRLTYPSSQCIAPLSVFNPYLTDVKRALGQFIGDFRTIFDLLYFSSDLAVLSVVQTTDDLHVCVFTQTPWSRRWPCPPCSQGKSVRSWTAT